MPHRYQLSLILQSIAIEESMPHQQNQGLHGLQVVFLTQEIIELT